MNEPLSEPSPTITDGQRHPQPTYDSLEDVMRQAAAETVKDLPPTSHRDETATPEIGDARPVAQPGQPPMSQWAVDLSRTMLAAGAASFMVGTPVVGILWVSGQANTTVIGIIFGAPVALVLAIGRLMGRAKQVVEAAPREIHNHMSGPVYQDHSTTETKTKNFSVTAETNNNPKEKP